VTNIDQLATRMARADEAFTKHVIGKRSLRDLAPEMGVSYETIRNDVAAFRRYLTEINSDNREERRAVFLAELDDRISKALDVYDLAMAQGKTLAAVAALNTISSFYVHKRAVEGLDAPREAKVEQSGEVRIVWDDGTGTPADPGYGEAPPTGVFQG
jgi:hypothetical protein